MPGMGLNGNRFKLSYHSQPLPGSLGYPPLVPGTDVWCRSAIAVAAPATPATPSTSTAAPTSNEDATHEAGESAAHEADENNGTFRGGPGGNHGSNEDATREAGETAAHEAVENAGAVSGGSTAPTSPTTAAPSATAK